MRHLFLVLLILLIPHSALAATLYLSPSSGAREQNKPFTVSVYLASADQPANAVAASIAVPADLFSVSAASSQGSIVNFWVSEPSISGGTVSFEGVILNPGYQGAGGKVASFTLTPKTAGAASLSFASASVLANDGQGTNILSGTTGASFTVAGAKTPEPAAPLAATEEPSAFAIVSKTHPDKRAWYRESTGVFSWSVPAGASATRIVLSSSPRAQPSVEYSPSIAEKTIEGMPEGVSYLRVQHKVAGAWTGIGTYRIQIDTTPPRPFSITFPHGASGINPQPIILFNTKDALSGIARYDVQVGEGGLLATAADATSNPYALPPQEPGAHVVIVSAFDEAGNVQTQSASFFIEGIDPPRITEYEERVAYKDLVKIRGLSYVNAQIEVYVRDREGEMVASEYTKSNALGDFAIILTKRLEPGTYALTARAIDARGARSPETQPLTFVVEGGFFTDLGFFIRDHVAVSLVIVLVLAACLGIHVYGWRKLLSLSHGVHAQSAAVTHRAFALLKKDLASHIRKVRAAGKNRVLTSEELAFLEEFEGELEDAEAVVEREVTKKRRKRLLP